MIKVDVCVGYLSNHGGIQTVLEGWEKELSRDVELRLVAPTGLMGSKWTEHFSRKEIASIGHYPLFIRYILGIFYIVSYAHKTDADLLILEQYKMIPIVRFVKKLFRKKYTVVSWMHQSLEVRDMLRTVCKSEKHLAISQKIAYQLMDEGVQKEDISIIYNPIHPKEKTITPSIEGNRFVYVGRLELQKQKNLKEMMDAFSEYSSKDWVLDIYGATEWDTEVQEYVKQIGIEKKVTFHPWEKNPFEHIEVADALLLTSNYEGFPMVLVEALSYGLPVISSDVLTGPSEIIQEGYNGYLYPLGNKKAFLQAIENIRQKKIRMDALERKESITRFHEDEYYRNLFHALKEMKVGND